MKSVGFNFGGGHNGGILERTEMTKCDGLVNFAAQRENRR